MSGKQKRKKLIYGWGLQRIQGSGSIQYTQSAAKRISSFITICMYFKQAGIQQEIDEFVDSLIDNTETIPQIVQNAFIPVRNGLISLININARMNADEIKNPKELEKRLKQELVKRFKAIQE